MKAIGKITWVVLFLSFASKISASTIEEMQIAILGRWCESMKPEHSACGTTHSKSKTYSYISSAGTKDDEFLKGATGTLYVDATEKQFLRLYVNKDQKFKRPMFGNAGKIESSGWNATWQIGVFAKDGGKLTPVISPRSRQWNTTTTVQSNKLILADPKGKFHEEWQLKGN